MKKSVKTALMVAVILLVGGMLLYSLGWSLGGRPTQLIQSRLFSGISIGSVHYNNYRDWSNDFHPNGEYSVAPADIKSINVDWNAGAAKIVPYDGENIVFVESALGELSEDIALRYGVANGVLNIQYCQQNPPNRLPEKQLLVRVPITLAGSLSELRYDASSASLSVSGLTAERFAFDATSGELDAADMSVTEAVLETSSGDIRFSGHYDSLQAGCTSGRVTVGSKGNPTHTTISTSSGAVILSGDCGELSIDVTSGDISSEGTVTASALSLNASSGSARLNGSFGAVQAESSSGQVKIRSTVCPRSLTIHSSSGNVLLALPKDSGFTLRYDTSSGNLNSEFSMRMDHDEFTVGDGAAAFEVDTASGDLAIEVQ